MARLNQWMALATCALLAACGSKDDESGPAQLAKSEYGLISPFDTLAVLFDQEVQLPNSDNVEPDSLLKVVAAHEDSLLLAGDTSIAGFAFFKPGSDYEVSFAKIKNAAGEEQSTAQTVRFQTMPFLDKDYTNCTDTYKDCDYNDWTDLADSLMNPAGSEFFDGSGLRTGMQSAGILSLGSVKEIAKYKQNDNHDYFLLKLQSGDTVELKLSGLRQPLNLSLEGPRSLKDADDFSTYDSTVTNDKLDSMTLIHVVGDEHRAGAASYSDKADYLVHASFRDANPTGPTPYVLAVKVRSYRQ